MKVRPKSALAMIMMSLVLLAAMAVIGENLRTVDQAASVSNMESDPFEKFRVERQQLRAMQKAQLNDIAHDAAAEAETADMARRRLVDICAAEEQELTVEGILSMRGFSDPIVTVHSGSVNVIIRAQALNRQETSVILDLVCRETGATAGDVKIIPIN